jgi:hypothetical protein
MTEGNLDVKNIAIEVILLKVEFKEEEIFNIKTDKNILDNSN